MVADGMSTANMLQAYPDLQADDIREALHYAADSALASEDPEVNTYRDIFKAKINASLESAARGPNRSPDEVSRRVKARLRMTRA
jgi:hypothetical protein